MYFPAPGPRPWPPIRIYQPWPKFVFTSPGPQLVFMQLVFTLNLCLCNFSYKSIFHLKNRFVGSRMKYSKQRNICVALLRKTKRKYYKDLRLSDVNDNKKFWKTIKPLFGNKIKCKSQVALVEGNDLVIDDKVLAKTFNKFFVNVAATLGIKYEKLLSNYDDSNYNLDELIMRYNDHPSILIIKNKCTELNSTFTFNKVDKRKYPLQLND